MTPIYMIAQGDVAISFLLQSSSPDGNGMGGMNVSRITDDAMATIANPAQLGLQGLHQYFSSGFYLSQSQWLPGLGENNITYNASAINVGLNLQQVTAIPFPVSVGVGYSRLYHDLGNFVTTNGSPDVLSTYDANEYSTNYSIAAGFDYIVKLGLGYTTKSIQSSLAPFNVQQQGRLGVANVSAYDLGLILQIPVVNVISRLGGTLPLLLPKVDPFCDLTFGYARSNLGDQKVVYIDAAQGDPLPRIATMGLNLKLGLISHAVSRDWEVVSFMIGREAEDILVHRFPAPIDSAGNIIGEPPPWQYVDGTGGIRFFNNLILGEWGGNIELRKGWQLNAGEMFYLRGGSYLGTGGQDYTTTGFGLRFSGIAKVLELVLPQLSSDQIFSFVERHVDLQYNESKYHPRDPFSLIAGTKYQGLKLIIK